MKTILLAFLLTASASVLSATPIVTNDPRPSGDMPFAEKKKIACDMYSQRMHEGSSNTGTMGGVRMSFGEYNYYYYLQDVLDFCVNNFNNQGA